MVGLRAVFDGRCEFIAGAQLVEQIPVLHKVVPEVAFIGRSNVGKSSLINAVVGKDGVARVSKTPGRTQQINFFNLNDYVILADLPGYGYAAVSKQMRKQWDGLIIDYLVGRPQLRRAFLLIDSRRGVMDIDEQVMKILDESAVSYQVVLTKVDVCKDLDLVISRVKERIDRYIAVYPEVLVTSSSSNIGVRDIRGVIMDFVNEG